MIAIGQSLGLWIPQVQGRYVNEDWNVWNQGFGAQCWDLAANWCKFNGWPVINTGGPGRWPGWAGNMVDAFPQTEEIATAFEVIDPAQRMEPGDIIVYDDSYPAWFPKTHVAVGVLDKGSWLLTMSQNSTSPQAGNPYPTWTTGPTVIQLLPRRGCIGFIRKRAGIAAQGSITQAEQDDEMTPEQFTAIMDKLARNQELLLSFQAAITDPITGYVGHAALSILAAGAATQYVKGSAEDTIYAREDRGQLRGITKPEWDVMSAAGEKFTEVPQEVINAWLAKAAV
jgi:hypothetical protein